MNVGQILAEREQLSTRAAALKDELDGIKNRIHLINQLLRLYDATGEAEEAAGTEWIVCGTCAFRARGERGLKTHMKKHEQEKGAAK